MDALRGTLDEFHAIAATHGGVCLSTHYENTRQTLRFRCAVGHEFEAHASSIKYRGHWCSYCRGTRHENLFGFVQDFARSRGGECLTKEFKGTKYKLRFRCSEGHEWEMRPHTIRRGWGWCRVCFDKAKFERVVEIAKANGGECLSDFAAYKGHKSPLAFRCVDGHEWHSDANSVTSGYWCPECTNKSEGLVRQFLECVFGIKLPSKSPAWINSAEFPRCVLDGYNEQSKLAFEYHGEQHYEHIDYFHEGDGKRTLKAQQARDAYVRARCAAHGVRLIEVPAIPQKSGREEFVALVRPLVEQTTGTAIAPELIDRFYTLPYQPSKIRQLADIAVARGGQCLSVKYLGVASPLQWRCAEGHEWEAAPSAIRTGQWCPFCGGNRIVDPMGEIEKLAHARGGRCLTTEYRGTHTKHLFECAKGHRFETTPHSIKGQDAWCERCSYEERGIAKRLPIEEVRAIAVKKGGMLLSEDYSVETRKLRFRCALGHEWEALPAAIKHKNWCPRCSYDYRRSLKLIPLDEVRDIAASKGGRLLSTEYLRDTKKLRFRCGAGHEWNAEAIGIKNGHWCPECAGRSADPLGKLQAIAADRGGQCLSASYHGSHTKLRFQCKAGHQWDAKPYTIRQGTWCPVCAAVIRATKAAETRKAKKLQSPSCRL